MPEPTTEQSRQYLDMGADLAGGAIGGALGFLAAGPGSAAAAGVAGVAIAGVAKRMISEFASRALSIRENERVAAAMLFAVDAISRKLDAGYTPRADGFLDGTRGNRSLAEELFEGVLQKARAEHEEKKVRLLGNLLASYCFTEGVGRGEANHLLHLTEDLTYRQLCVLRLLHLKPHIQELALRATDYSHDAAAVLSRHGAEWLSLVFEIWELVQRGLIARRNPGEHQTFFMVGWNKIVPDYLVLLPVGSRLASAFGMPEDPLDDLQSLVVSYLSEESDEGTPNARDLRNPH